MLTTARRSHRRSLRQLHPIRHGACAFPCFGRKVYPDPKAQSKSANGHRYVFHYRAVSASERTYREGEPGVLNLPASNLRIALPGEAVLRPVSVNEPLAVRRPRSNTLCGETDAAAPAMVARQSRSHYRTLQHGDTLYWHQLVMGGERITPVGELRRARSIGAGSDFDA
jgi:hypothetical protein